MDEKRDFIIRDGILVGYQGPGGDVAVPDGVTRIGPRAFRGCIGLTGVSIPEGVTDIGWSAFMDCTGLERAVIPEGVLEIRAYAFDGCTGLKSAVIPEGVTRIGEYAFSGCSSLTGVSIPEGVTEIGGSAFENCTGLTSVTVPDSVTKIGDHAFSGCVSLTSVSIPEGLTDIGDGAFPDGGSRLRVETRHIPTGEEELRLIDDGDDGKDFVQSDAEVYYLRPECVDESVRAGVVDAVHEDRAEVHDRYLGDVTVDLDMIFRTREEAEKACGYAMSVLDGKEGLTAGAVPAHGKPDAETRPVPTREEKLRMAARTFGDGPFTRAQAGHDGRSL